METTLDIKITDLLTPLCYGPSTIPREINSPSSSLTNQIHTQSILCWCSCHISFSSVELWSQRQIRISMLCMSLWIKRPSALCGLTCCTVHSGFSHIFPMWLCFETGDKSMTRYGGWQFVDWWLWISLLLYGSVKRENLSRACWSVARWSLDRVVGPFQVLWYLSVGVKWHLTLVRPGRTLFVQKNKKMYTVIRPFPFSQRLL